jgi:hypothetical protein
MTDSDENSLCILNLWFASGFGGLVAEFKRQYSVVCIVSQVVDEIERTSGSFWFDFNLVAFTNDHLSTAVKLYIYAD